MILNHWIKRQFRKKTRVYILPTRMGGYLNGLIFLMFLLSIGYSNNLLLIFTILLFAFNLLWVIQSHFHLHPLKLAEVLLPKGHAGETLPIKVRWSSGPQAPYGWALTLESKNQNLVIRVLESNQEASLGELTLPNRGRWSWTHLKVVSELPFGLYRVWCFYPLNQESLVYPSLIKMNFRPALSGEHHEGEHATGRRGSEDLWELMPYQGQETRKISWKHYARTGEVLIKEGEELNHAIYKIELKLPQNVSEKEAYLSRLASEMVQCHRQEIPFHFKTHEGQWGPSKEDVHLAQCLKVLTLC